MTHHHADPIPADFGALLAEREYARERHQDLCEVCNEPDEMGRLDSAASTRDRWYARLQELEAAIAEQCAEERRLEELDQVVS